MSKWTFKLTTTCRFEICNSSSDIDRQRDRDEIVDWTLDKIEEPEFQAGDAKIDLLISTYHRNYEVMLYRDDQNISVWIDWDFAYEIPISADLRSRIGELCQWWRHVPGIKMIYRWDWNDPQLKFNWMLANYWQIENGLYEDFIDWLKESNKYDDYVKQPRQEQERKFNDWLFNNYYKIVEAFTIVS